MIQSNHTKVTKSQKHAQEEEKKQKSSLMKKILIKNKIVSILSHQPRKLMKLAKMGNMVYKNLQQHTLLPKLTLTNLFPEIQDFNKKNQLHQEKFDEVNKELTCSMLNFQHKFSQISQQDQGKILNLQTQKCYSHIPVYFFSDLSPSKIQEILTKNKREAQQYAYDLIDYQDQIEYNINQQVGYKMKVFMDFADFLQALAGLVDISCKKIQTSRARSNIVREIIVQKSINIKILRVKQTNLTKCIQIVDQLKKVKQMQKSLMSLIHAKGKISIGDFHQQYLKQHEKIKDFCCRRGLCNFGDIKYYVEKNYQETFSKSLQDYLLQLAKIDKEKLSEILKPSKAIYISMPFQSRNSQTPKYGQRTFAMDQSIQLEDQFELTVKTNIEKQISNLFEMGLQKCTYSTDYLCACLKQHLNDLEMQVYRCILSCSDKPKQDVLDNLVNSMLNRPTQQTLNTYIEQRFLNYHQKSQIMNKIPLQKFLHIAELLSQRLMDLVIRSFSIINELMRIVKVKIQTNFPQKEQIINVYLIQLVLISINFANQCLGSFINLREIKETQIQMVDKLINICQDWQDLIAETDTKYEFLWRKLVLHFSDVQGKINRARRASTDSGANSFKDLQGFVKLNYKPSIIDSIDQQYEDVSQQLMSKSQIKLQLLSDILQAKNQKLNFNFYSLSRLIINKNLSKVIESQTWLPISMNQKIQNSVGFIMYGQQYLNRLDSQNNSHNFLSKSLLLEKSNFGIKRKSEEVIPSEEDFEIQMNQKWIKIGDRSFRIVGVTEYILEVVYLFFLYFDKYSVQEELHRQGKNGKENVPEKSIQPPKLRLNLLMTKTCQILLTLTSKIKYYVNNLKQLQKKVKSFAKFLLLTYVQLDFFKTIIAAITNQNSKHRFQQNNFQKYTQKEILQTKKSFFKQVDECMSEIAKKYNSIGYEKIKESIKKMEFNPKKQIKVPSEMTSDILAYFSKSLEIIKDIIIDSKQFYKFLNSPWIKPYLQKVNEHHVQLRKFVLKSNSSNSGRRIEEIQWQDKLDWKAREINWLLTAIQNEGYTEHIRDIKILEDELKRITQVNKERK